MRGYEIRDIFDSMSDEGANDIRAKFERYGTENDEGIGMFKGMSMRECEVLQTLVLGMLAVEERIETVCMETIWALRMSNLPISTDNMGAILSQVNELLTIKGHVEKTLDPEIVTTYARGEPITKYAKNFVLGVYDEGWKESLRRRHRRESLH